MKKVKMLPSKKNKNKNKKNLTALRRFQSKM